VYIAAENDLDTAVALTVVMLAFSFGLLLALRLARERFLVV
jgi:molybdate transport system permease protein